MQGLCMLKNNNLRQLILECFSEEEQKLFSPELIHSIEKNFAKESWLEVLTLHIESEQEKNV